MASLIYLFSSSRPSALLQALAKARAWDTSTASARYIFNGSVGKSQRGTWLCSKIRFSMLWSASSALYQIHQSYKRSIYPYHFYLSLPRFSFLVTTRIISTVAAVKRTFTITTSFSKLYNIYRCLGGGQDFERPMFRMAEISNLCINQRSNVKRIILYENHQSKHKIWSGAKYRR